METFLPERTEATAFHAGNLCPACQTAIAEREEVVSCPSCRTFHHGGCWDNRGRCSAYHCDPSVRREGPPVVPDLVLGKEDLASVVVPPKVVRKTGAARALDFVPPPPERTSILAMAATGLAGLGASGILGLVLGVPKILGAGIVLGILAMGAGTVALVLLQTRPRLKGNLFAMAGVGGGVLELLVFLVILHHTSPTFSSGLALNFAPFPTDAEVKNLAPPILRAFKANVFIQGQGRAMLGRTLWVGSGIILGVRDGKAAILTNRHVADPGYPDSGKKAASKAGIKVRFFNGEESDAEIKWIAPHGVDLAIIACPALTVKDVETRFGRPADVGQKVFAMGNPHSLGWSYTEGVVSSLRTRSDQGFDLKVYQTQTPINQGNSGGGLYDERGNLVGINTWTEDKAVSENINFSIAAEALLKLLEQGGQEFIPLVKQEPPSSGK